MINKMLNNLEVVSGLRVLSIALFLWILLIENPYLNLTLPVLTACVCLLNYQEWNLKVIKRGIYRDNRNIKISQNYNATKGLLVIFGLLPLINGFNVASFCVLISSLIAYFSIEGLEEQKLDDGLAEQKLQRIIDKTKAKRNTSEL